MRKLSKRILAIVLVAIMASMQAISALAGTVTVTNSSWWDAWTPTYEIADGATVSLEVDMVAAGTASYQSLNAVFCTVETDGVTLPSDISGYSEYVVLRSDSFGWGTYYSTTTYTGTDYLYNSSISDYSTILTGAVYDITITRDGTTINYDFLITEADGVTQLDCGYEIVIAELADEDSAYVFFTGDAGVSFTVTEVEAFEAVTVTNAAWWDAWSPSYEITDGTTVSIDVTLDETGTGSYQSLNAIFCSVETDGVTTPSDFDGYEEYVVLRSDSYGWGTYYSTTTYTGTDYLYDSSISDYSTILTGATYDITIKRSGTTITYDFVITEADGETQLNCGYSTIVSDLTSDDGVYVFFTGDAGVTFTITNVKTTTNKTVSTDSYDITTSNHVSVHDPSIVKGYVEESVTSLDMDTEIMGVADDTHTKAIYFIFGSHLAFAYSWDLCTWTTFANNITTNYESLFVDEAAWSALGGSSYDLSGNMWAPDVIWNESMGKWCMYMSINGDNWYSTICMLTADSLYGDWTYVGMVIQSGNYNYASTGATFDYYTATGETESSNNLSRYTANRNGNLTYEDNCIDPCVTYDEDGNLWMTYGSWFGGIWMIKLDETTGLRDYTYTYEYVENETDPYQGYKLAGGFHSSGEASYIEYYGGYYYLFVTYGELTASGGYNMRVYRSESITGPYVDESGDAASYTAYLNNTSSTVGMRLMSYYKWSYQTYAQVAQGHNSVYYDEDTDQIYIVYHTRTNDGTEGHSIRVHQLFQNEDGWLVAAPFEYQGETTTNEEIANTSAYELDDLVGNYEVLLQSQSVDYASLAYVEPSYIVLNADGSISGDLTGTWSTTSGTCYITLVTGTDTYHGVLLTQTVEDGDSETITFTGVGVSTETAIWGYKYNALEQDYETLSLPAQTANGTSLDLVTTGTYGASISWASSDESLVATDGTVVAIPEENTDVTLTATLSDEDGNMAMKSFTVTVLGTNAVDEDGNITVWSSAETYDLTDAVQGTYAFPNYFNSSVGTAGLDLYGGVSIKFTVEQTGTYNLFSNILGFTVGGETASGNIMYFTGGSYLGYNATGGYFDANCDTSTWTAGTDYIGSGQEVEIEIIILASTYEVYVDGELAFSKDTVDNGETSGNYEMDLMYSVLTWLNGTATEFDLGWGSWWEGGFAGTISNITLTALAEEAVDTSGYVYYANYSNAGGSLSDWASTNDSANLVLSNDGDSHGNYVTFQTNTGTNSRGAYTTALSAAGVSANYTVDVDIKLKNGSSQTSEFTIFTSGASGYTGNDAVSSGYILKLAATAAGATTYYVNDGTDTVTIPADTWVHITATVAEDGETVTAVISYDGADDQEITTAVNGSSTLMGLYVRRGRYNGYFCVDNIAVTCLHVWDDGEVITEATCTEDGEMLYTCTVCGETKTEVIEATGHSYEVTEEIEPTADEEGSITYTCSKCGHSYTETIEALGHTITITEQPQDMTVAPAVKTTFSITAEGDDLSYTWYYLKDGAEEEGSWPQNTSALRVTSNATWEGMQVYCIVSDGYGNFVKSDTITIHVEGITITTQPSEDTITVGEKSAFTIQASGTTTLTYKWYYLKEDQEEELAWPQNTNTLKVTSNSTWEGMQVWCVVSDENGNEVTSDVLTMHVVGVTISVQPTDTEISVGEKSAFKVVADGVGLTYKWYYKKAGSTEWGSWPQDSAVLRVTANSTWEGMEVYCEITSADGTTVTTDTITITLAE